MPDAYPGARPAAPDVFADIAFGGAVRPGDQPDHPGQERQPLLADRIEQSFGLQLAFELLELDEQPPLAGYPQLGAFERQAGVLRPDPRGEAGQHGHAFGQGAGRVQDRRTAGELRGVVAAGVAQGEELGGRGAPTQFDHLALHPDPAAAFHPTLDLVDDSAERLRVLGGVACRAWGTGRHQRRRPRLSCGRSCGGNEKVSDSSTSLSSAAGG